MRVITGSARGRKLTTLEGLDVRPTTDKVKESLFNIVQFDVPDSRVLDLFAGSGQLGIEALSRGAASAVFVDSSARAIQVVGDNLEHTGLLDRASLKHMGAQQFLSGSAGPFDLAFLDPPYRKQILPQILPLLADKMSEDGVMVCETAAEETLPERAGNFALAREYRYGKIKLSVYRKREGTD